MNTASRRLPGSTACGGSLLVTASSDLRRGMKREPPHGFNDGHGAIGGRRSECYAKAAGRQRRPSRPRRPRRGSCAGRGHRPRPRRRRWCVCVVVASLRGGTRSPRNHGIDSRGCRGSSPTRRETGRSGRRGPQRAVSVGSGTTARHRCGVRSIGGVPARPRPPLGDRRPRDSC